MIKILEKMYGERIILICENNIKKSGNASIKLISDSKEIKTDCSVMVPKSCFSEPTVIYIMLPKGFDATEVELFKTIEFL